MPSNTSCALATVIGSLPYTISDSTSAGAPSLWWKFVGLTGINVIGVWVQTSAFVSPFVFTPDCTTAFPHSSSWGASTNRPLQFPTTTGTTYYVNVKATLGHSGATGSFTLSVVAAPADAVQVGDIWVNDDTDGFPLAILSSTDASVRQFQTPVGAGECADVLPSGMWLLHNNTTDHVELYSSQGVLVADVASGTTSTDKPIRSNKAHAWYVGRPQDVTNANHATVSTFTDAGAFGPTTWTMPAAGMKSLSPSLDETILYYVPTVTGLSRVVARWDLVNNVALTDLVPDLGLQPLNDNVMVLADDTILSGYIVSSTATRINRYNAAGTLLNTYNFTGVGATRTPKIASALDDPASFWVWNKLPTNYSQFQNIRVSDGAVLTTLTAALFEDGKAELLTDPTSPTRFGHSESCAFFLMRRSIPLPTPITGMIAGTIDPTVAALSGLVSPPKAGDCWRRS